MKPPYQDCYSRNCPASNEDADSWNRLTQLAATITEKELLELDARDILHRLFHEESIRLLEPDPVRFECSCSRDRTLDMVKSLGRQEALDILEEQGQIDISCEFCNAQYQFDLIDIEQLFASDAPLSAGTTQH